MNSVLSRPSLVAELDDRIDTHEWDLQEQVEHVGQCRAPQYRAIAIAMPELALTGQDVDERWKGLHDLRLRGL